MNRIIIGDTHIESTAPITLHHTHSDMACIVELCISLANAGVITWHDSTTQTAMGIFNRNGYDHQSALQLVRQIETGIASNDSGTAPPTQTSASTQHGTNQKDCGLPVQTSLSATNQCDDESVSTVCDRCDDEIECLQEEIENLQEENDRLQDEILFLEQRLEEMDMECESQRNELVIWERKYRESRRYKK